MFVDIEIYIQRSKEKRSAHLDLVALCIEIGGNSETCRGLLAHYLKTTIPRGMKIHLCHACHNGKCSNPVHLYWGTASENWQDTLRSGARQSISQEAREIFSANGKASTKHLSQYSGKKRWVTDGMIDRRIADDEKMPAGFRKGRTGVQFRPRSSEERTDAS